jgi:hypothetical protein
VGVKVLIFIRINWVGRNREVYLFWFLLVSVLYIGCENERLGMKYGSIGMRNERLGMKTRSTGMRNERLGMKYERLGMKYESIGMKTRSTGMRKKDGDFST